LPYLYQGLVFGSIFFPVVHVPKIMFLLFIFRVILSIRKRFIDGNLVLGKESSLATCEIYSYKKSLYRLWQALKALYVRIQHVFQEYEIVPFLCLNQGMIFLLYKEIPISGAFQVLIDQLNIMDRSTKNIFTPKMRIK
jgi:hypothetical protein